LLAILYALRERTQVRRGVGAVPQAVSLQDRRDHARRRRLAVRADHVDAREAALRHPEHRHELVHAVEPEPHAEQLEVEQVRLCLAEGHATSLCRGPGTEWPAPARLGPAADQSGLLAGSATGAAAEAGRRRAARFV